MIERLRIRSEQIGRTEIGGCGEQACNEKEKKLHGGEWESVNQES